MTKLKLALSVFAVAAAFASSAYSAGPTPDGINVNVTNTPLPVTGTFAGTVTGAVSVNNTAASPVPVRDVDNAARQPTQFRLCGAHGGGIPVSCFGTPFSVEVPSDRRLIIEYVSGECALSGDVNGARVGVGTIAGGVGAEHRFHLQADTLDKRFLDLAQQTRLYADPGSTVSLGMSSGGGANPSGVVCNLTISGYTVTQ